MDSTQAPSTGQNGGKPAYTRFLRPPWPKGVSGNPSGRASDGGGAKDAPLRKLLRAKAKRRSELKRLVESWWDAACNGSDVAREQILKRLDPLLDDPAAGRQVLTGLLLELKVGDGPVTQVRGLVGSSEGELRGSEALGVPIGGLDDPRILDGTPSEGQVPGSSMIPGPSETPSPWPEASGSA